MKARYNIFEKNRDDVKKHEKLNDPKNQQLVLLGLQESVLVKYINTKIDNLGKISVDRVMFRMSNNSCVFLVVNKYMCKH